MGSSFSACAVYGAENIEWSTSFDTEIKYLIDQEASVSFKANEVDEQFPDEKKLQKAAEAQLEKVESLQETLINYLADNDVETSEKVRWKSDFDEVQKYRDQLPNLDSQTFPHVTKNSILDPSDLKRLNEIYKRWS